MACKIQKFEFKSSNGINTIKGKVFIPIFEDEIKGVVQISHGMCEYIERYEDFARFLADNNYIVYMHDHIGHGKSVESNQELGYFALKDGYKYLVRDVYEITKIIKTQYPNQPLFLFGHSMGSFISRCYIAKYENVLTGVIISGTAGPNRMANAGIKLCDYIIAKKGDKYRSKSLEKLSTGTFNKSVKNPKTKFDWISTDEQIVEKYKNDKYCNFTFTVSAYKDLFTLSKYANHNKWAENVPNIPIYMFSGKQDHVGDFGKGVETVYNNLKKTGKTDITLKLYPNGRHEMLNEVNKKEVYHDILVWLNGKVEK